MFSCNVGGKIKRDYVYAYLYVYTYRIIEKILSLFGYTSYFIWNHIKDNMKIN